ncbi:MAG: hypothetical protein Q8M94_00160 [Ignavibacteria bacterium]|nr:hypothetical protein [Ignavibacteria bacterium]
MFENEIKFISDFTLNKVKELGSFITVEKLLSTDIHPSIKKYVVGEINYLIFEDRKKLIENSLFDYSGKEISNYFELIGEEIKKTKKISYEDIKNIVLQAVSFNANYVVRPKWSLSKLIFGNNKSVSVNEIQMMLRYTYYYEYLNNVFLAYISKKKILSISVTEFELIMNKIDRELFMLHQSKLVDNALYAIADYFSIGGLNKSSITIESAENFLKEKNLTELLFKLKRAYSGTTKKKADIDDIRKVLYSTLLIDSPFVEDNDQATAIADEKHFENPLKENFIEEDLIRETDSIGENETVFDLKSEIQSEVFETEEQYPDNTTLSSVEITEPETVEEIEAVIEQAIEQTEPEKFDITQYEIDNTVTSIVDEKNIEDISKTILEPEPVDDSIPVDDNRLNIQESVEEEDILASLTDEIEKEKDEEIIILDEKEQEDLLNFYDNELEISIDDDIPADKIKKRDTEVEKDLEAEIGDLEFEHEILIKDNIDDEVSLEKIDFEKGFGSDVDTKSSSDKEADLSATPLVQKRGDDIFNYLSKKEIDRIIKNLFNSDSEDFANTVEKMSACKTYEEATLVLENLFKYARIKPHSRDAASLTNAVAKYFNMEK